MQLIKNKAKRALNTARRRVLCTLHDQLAGVLSRETLAAREASHGGGSRSRVYPPPVTLGLFIEQVIGCYSACQDATGRALIWRTSLGLSVSTLDTGLCYTARQCLPLSLIEQLTNE